MASKIMLAKQESTAWYADDLVKFQVRITSGPQIVMNRVCAVFLTPDEARTLAAQLLEAASRHS